MKNRLRDSLAAIRKTVQEGGTDWVADNYYLIHRYEKLPQRGGCFRYPSAAELIAAYLSEQGWRAEEESLKTRIRIGADMIDEMRAVSREYIESAVNMMSMCASYLYTSRIITTDPNVLAYRISGYIDENIKTCSLESICKRFYISRSRLYSICIEFFGMGVSELIRCRKIKLSEKYLVETDLSIDEIAENVGIKNANYLIRIFKSTHGITPHKYRIKYAKCK